MRGVLRVLLTLALATTCTFYFMAEKRVTLADGGSERTVTTFAPTVGAALERLGITLGPDDLVLPSAKSALSPRIEVRRARDVVVVLNGARRVERVSGRTVAQILNEIAVAHRGAYLHPGADAAVEQGEEIVVAQPVQVTVVQDGVAQPVVTNVLTAGALLRQMAVALGPQDRVEPSIVAYPGSGTTIKVVRVREVLERVHARIAFKRVTRRSDQLEFGLRRLATAGADGVRARLYRITYEDGKIVGKVFLGSEVVQPPRDEVMLLGTRRPVFNSHGFSDTGKATWYSAPGLTAAHRTLPFGTVVRVTNLANGRSIAVTIRDRGPFGAGRIIDLSSIAFGEIAPLGAGVINVKIEW